jgi:hypothetical protein
VLLLLLLACLLLLLLLRLVFGLAAFELLGMLRCACRLHCWAALGWVHQQLQQYHVRAALLLLQRLELHRLHNLSAAACACSVCCC